MTEPYRGRVAALGTRHGKEIAIAPALAVAGLEVRVVDVDTDRFGTFSAEVARTGTPLETVVAKAEAALAAGACDLGLASEGSFVPHPDAPWVTVDHELVALVDRREGITIVGRASSVATVSVAGAVGAADDLAGLVRRADLPAHALTVHAHAGSPEPVTKGVRDVDALARAVAGAAARSPDGRAMVQTDFRAHVCPSRRDVIASAARDLARRLVSRCPACGTPGWGTAETLLGVPCEWCGCDVEIPSHEVDACVRCSHRVVRPIVAPDARADPARCGTCNP